MNNPELGVIAYDAYCEAREWKSISGECLPHFKEQSKALQEAWIKSAQAVADYISLKTGRG